MRLLRTINLAIKSLLLHKMRSALTMLGIVFGVFSVIAMLAIGEGASRKAQDQVLELGANNIIVVSVKPPQQASNNEQSSGFGMFRYGLLRDDMKLLGNGAIPHVTAVIPIREVTKEARYLHRTMNSRLVGCTPEYFDINHLGMRSGRFLTQHDGEKLSNVAVIASDVADTLFPGDNPLGKSFQVEGDYYEIIGVTRSRTASAAIGGSLSGQDYNKDVYIPLETMQVRIGDDNFQRGQGSMTSESIQLHVITLQVDDSAHVISTADVIRETLELNHAGKNDYDVIVPMELLEQARQIRLIFNLVLGSIAAISLVVGGIGIMNIMLATVTERTREIGIRRALGAKRRDITEQFLTETIVLSGIGGIIGVILGVLTPHAFAGIQWLIDNLGTASAPGENAFDNIFSGLKPIVQTWSLGLAFGISVGIGVMFGVYPAISAARLDPIEALRHE
jgi:putative ABC transport system permease protein